jgi:ribosome-binding factor A
MSQGSRPERVADQLRSELALLLSREVHDPGVGFVTLTRVHVSPDLQQARVLSCAGRSARASGSSGRLS